VAGRFLADLQADTEEVRRAVVEFMPASFAAAGAMARRYQREERRWAASCWGADKPRSALPVLPLPSMAGQHAFAWLLAMCASFGGLA
jgi:hypothetical protein